MSEISIVLTPERYAEIMAAVDWCRRASNGFINLPLGPSQAGTDIIGQALRSGRWWVGQITPTGPEGQDGYPTNPTRAYYWVKSTFVPWGFTSSKDADAFPKPHQDDDANILWVSATNLPDIHQAAPGQRYTTLLPGTHVIVYEVATQDGDKKYFLNATASETDFNNSTWVDLRTSAGDTLTWKKNQIAGGPVDFSWTSNGTSDNETATLQTNDSPDPRWVRLKPVHRIVNGDASNLPKVHSRDCWLNNTGAYAELGVDDGGVVIGQRLTVVTDVKQVVENVSGQYRRIKCQKKTREIIVWWAGTESAWTDSGSADLAGGGYFDNIT